MTLTPHDLLRLRFVADPRLAPTGDLAVATVTEIVAGEGDKPPRYRTRIHGFDLRATARDPSPGRPPEPGLTGGSDADRASTGAPNAGNPYAGRPTMGRMYTLGEGSDTHPRFDPTGRLLAFLRAAPEERAQVHVLPLDGGESRSLSERAAGVSAFAWHPDGTRLACISPARDDVPQERRTPLRVTRARHQAEGTGLLAEVPNEVLLLPAATIGSSSGSPKEDPRVIAELAYGASQLAFSPDGDMVYVLAPTSEREHAELRANILVIPVAGGEPRALLPDATRIPSFAVDDRSGDIVFLAPVDRSKASAPAGLWLVPPDGGAPTLITGDLDVAPSIAADSRYGAYPATPVPVEDGWLCAVNTAGRSNLERIARDGTRTALTSGDRAITAFDSIGAVSVFVAEAPDRPGDLFVLGPGGSEARLGGLNDALADDVRFRAPGDPVTFQGDGGDLTYWRLDPTTPRDDAAIVVQVHGGPAANYGYGFMFEFQLLAANGYTVVYGNPRGGSSFGLPFASAIQGRYGSIDADDVMAIVEHAAAAHSVPGAPVHLTGGSYGGFMTNWLVGHTDRFASAVTQRSICNFVSFYGTSDIGPWFTEREVGGRPWEDLELLWRQSPLAYVADIETPLLVMHSENDRRCPIEQAEQLYAALKRIGRAPTELVRFPGEGHELPRSGRPDRRIARLEAILEWFARHA